MTEVPSNLADEADEMWSGMARAREKRYYDRGAYTAKRVRE